MARESYPLGLSLSTVALTALGLGAAALGIQWGAAPAAGDALRESWLYVNVMGMCMWFILWPAVALRPPSPLTPPLPLLWQGAAIFSAAIPATVVAGWLSAITLRMAALMLALQLAAGLLMLGLITLHRYKPVLGGVFAGVIATLTLAGPVAVFLWMLFFPQASHAWDVVCPLITVGHAAVSEPAAGLWGVVAVQAIAGALLLLLGSKIRTPAHPHPIAPSPPAPA